MSTGTPKPKKPATHFMLDLETLGIRPGCALLSIGCVKFDIPHSAIESSYYEEILRGSCMELGMFVEDSTLQWWEKQEERGLLERTLRKSEGCVKLYTALTGLNSWIALHTPDGRRPVMWARGANFDFPLIRAAYDKLEIKPVWSPFDERCQRTFVELAPNVPVQQVGKKHNAIDDCLAQCAHMFKVCEVIGRIPG